MTNEEMFDRLHRLIQLFAKTNFTDGDTAWDGIKVDKEDGHVYVPQGSTLGDTLIGMVDVYERGGDDAMFIQQVIKFYKEVYDVIRSDNA